MAVYKPERLRPRLERSGNISKMMNNLEAAKVIENPNIGWNDIAGLLGK